MFCLFKQLRSLAHDWWRADLIRVSPDDGRLLRLQPPCYLRIGAETLEITQRRQLKQGIVYDCADGSELRITLTDLRQPLRISWSTGQQALDLNPFEVEVFQPANAKLGISSP